jgi:calcineurin-like phosphoesterase family protein
MKTEIIGESTQEKEINWNKKMVVISTLNGDVVLTTGSHNSTDFSGMRVFSNDYQINDFDICWDKKAFKLVKETINIKFSND